MDLKNKFRALISVCEFKLLIRSFRYDRLKSAGGLRVKAKWADYCQYSN